MPIVYGNFTKELKLLPLVLKEDGSASVTIRYGFVGEDGNFTVASSNGFEMSASVVSAILDAEPRLGMTRRDDLSLAIYTYLVENGLVEPGTIY